MQKKWLVVSCIALLVGILATAALAGNPVKLFVNGQKSMIKDENEQEEVVRLVEDFGRKLKSVSLLAPQETVNKSVQENYGDFIAPALLAEWQKDLQKVPGRLLSSPWPERIEILSVNELAESGYLVKGEIIEMTSVEMVNGGAAARRPITLEVEKLKNRWLITAVQMDSYVEAGATVYKNTEYGFSFSLPESWRGYSVIADEWEGFTPGGSVAVEKGPLISIRHPQWTAQNQRQDIPIMIFTQGQWKAMQSRKFHIGAAPVGPRELGSNSSYVFALPARYNYAFPAGYEEVEEILQGNPFKPLENTEAESVTADSQVVQVYFISTGGEPGGLYPANREVPGDADPVQAALEEMLKGPTEDEYLRGYRSHFSERSAGMLRGITRNSSGDVLTLDFADFRNLFGENKVPSPTSFGPGGVMADITWTVFKQFPDVQALRFAFNGDEGVFWSWLAGAPCEPEVFTRNDWEQV